MKKLLILVLLLSTMVFARSQESYEQVRVSHSEPIYKHVTIKKPIRECYDEEYLQRSPSRRVYSQNNSIGLDTIIGATAGVVIGNQIGRGNGRTAAKIVGGLLGGTIANNMRNEPSYGNDEYVTRTRTKCITKYEKVRTKRIIDGYKNYFNYEGREYFKVSKKAKRKIKVFKTITF